jgi:hypothetical protein
MERDERATTVDDEEVDAASEERPTTADIASGTETEVRADDVETNDVEKEREGVEDAGEAQREPLLADAATSEVRSRWEQIQGSFVDEPRRAVEEADSLVAELMQRLADSFAEERKGLEGQWDRGDEVSTEDLRIALQRYRSFFDRLLSA